VRARHGLAWYALFNHAGRLEWSRNPRYVFRELPIAPPRAYPELGLEKGTPIYAQFASNPAAMQWVSEPALVKDTWAGFTPL